MTKSIKIAKMNFIDIIKAIGIYYISLIAVLMVLFSIGVISDEHNSISGLEVSTMIFIFVCGLNSFKESFYFTQSNNISRKTFLKGTLLTSLSIGILMAIIDFIINRIMNLFMPSPSLYDMGYTTLRNLNNLGLHSQWVQSNSILTIINTILLAFVIYCFAYILGLVINMIYFRADTIMKIAISVIGGGLLITWISTDLSIAPLKVILGINAPNVYIGILTLFVICGILTWSVYLLIKNAEVGER